MGKKKEYTMEDDEKAGKLADDMMREFVQDWMAVATLAYANSQRPKEPDSRSYWELGLIGNLAWAVAGLATPVTPALAAVIVVGAVLGSGAVDKVANPSTDKPPSPADALAKRVAKTADELEKHLLKKRRDENWQIELSFFDLDSADGYLKAMAYVWERKFFLGTKFQDRRESLLKKMIQTIESQLASFNLEWQTYFNAVKSCYYYWTAYPHNYENRYAMKMCKNNLRSYLPVPRFDLNLTE